MPADEFINSCIYAVDPSTGTARANILTGNSWYDYSSNLLQRINPGDGQVFSKSAYNGVGWVSASYTGYTTTGTSYSQANTPAGDVILEQTQNTFDEGGEPGQPSEFSSGSNDAPLPETGSTGRALLRDAAGGPGLVHRELVRRHRSADRHGQLPARSPALPVQITRLPLARTALVQQHLLQTKAGQPSQTTDPMGYVTQTSYDTGWPYHPDGRGLRHRLLNRTTNWTYSLDSLIATLTAVNAITGNQTTTWTYDTKSDHLRA